MAQWQGSFGSSGSRVSAGRFSGGFSAADNAAAAKNNAISDQQQHLVNSFKTLDSGTRQSLLSKFKITDPTKYNLLAQHVTDAVPKTPNYTDNSIGGKIYRFDQGMNKTNPVAKKLAEGVVGGTADFLTGSGGQQAGDVVRREKPTSTNPSGRVLSVQGGNMNSNAKVIRDTAVQSAENMGAEKLIGLGVKGIQIARLARGANQITAGARLATLKSAVEAGTAKQAADTAAFKSGMGTLDRAQSEVQAGKEAALNSVKSQPKGLPAGEPRVSNPVANSTPKTAPVSDAEYTSRFNAISKSYDQATKAAEKIGAALKQKAVLNNVDKTHQAMLNQLDHEYVNGKANPDYKPGGEQTGFAPPKQADTVQLKSSKPATPTDKKLAAIDNKLNDFKTNPHTKMLPEDARALQKQRGEVVAQSKQDALDKIAQQHSAETGQPLSASHETLAAGSSPHSAEYQAAQEAPSPKFGDVVGTGGKRPGILSSQAGGGQITYVPGVADVTKAVEHARTIGSGLTDAFHPSISNQEKDIFYTARGAADFAKHEASQHLEEANKYFNSASFDDRRNFVQKIMTGNTAALSPVEQRHAALIDGMLEKQLQYEQPYIETARQTNYFPTSGIWDRNPDSGALAAQGKTLGGNKSFLKNKVFADLSQGEAAGGKIRGDFNPVDLVQRRVYEGTKAVELVKNLQQAEKLGLASKEAAPGLVQAKDPALKGWWMSPKIALMVDRHNSTNWFTDSELGRSISAVKASGTAIKLGLSAAHATQSTIIRIMDKVGLGAQKLLAPRGTISGKMRLSGIGDIAGSPLAPIRDLMKHLPGKSNEDVRNFFIGGGKLRQDEQYAQTFGHAKQAFADGQMLAGLGKGAFELNSKILSPLFNRYIPDMKVASVADRIAFETQLRAKDIAAGKTSMATIARDAVKQADQSFGEMNYDNLHWNNTVKGAAQFATRALGWTYGNAAQLIKGGLKTPLDAVRVPAGLVTGKGKGLSPEAGKLWGLVATIATVSSVYQKLHTGHWPMSGLDFIEPQTGQKDANGKPVRAQFLNPLNDALSLNRDVKQGGVVAGTGKFLAGKEADALSLITSLLTNRDWLGNYVYDPKAGWVDQAKQVAGAVGTGLLPISVSNITSPQTSSGKINPVEGFFGVTKASTADAKTPLENDINQQVSAIPGLGGPKTPDQVKLSNLKSSAVADMRAGKTDSPNISKFKASVDPKKFSNAQKEATMSSDAYQFSLLGNDAKIKILLKYSASDVAPLKGAATDQVLKEMLTRNSVQAVEAKGITADQITQALKKAGYNSGDVSRVKAQAKKQAAISRRSTKKLGKFTSPDSGL